MILLLLLLASSLFLYLCVSGTIKVLGDVCDCVGEKILISFKWILCVFNIGHVHKHFDLLTYGVEVK